MAVAAAKPKPAAATLAIETWPIDKPVPYLGNARRLSDRAISVVASSIKEFGFRQPIVVDKKGVVIVGHTRLLAAQQLGLETVPVHVARNLTPAQTDAYRLMDNRASEETEWNPELLGPQLLKLEKAGVDLGLTGFTSEEITKFLKLASLAAAQCDEDEVPAPPSAPVSRVGDVWLCGEHRVRCGDSTAAADTAALFGGALPEDVFADPPYGINIVKGNKVGSGGPTTFGKDGTGKIVPAHSFAAIAGDESSEMAQRFYECARSVGVKAFILWGGNYFTHFLPPSPCWIVWDKQNGANNFADVEMAWSNLTSGKAREAELAWSSYPKGARLYSYLWTGLSREGDRKSELVSRVHPTQKPVGLFERIFDDFPFGSCYDGFLGSGSTLIACQKAGRRCFGMELAREYVDVAVMRWQNFTGLEARLEGGGTYAETKADRIQL